MSDSDTFRSVDSLCVFWAVCAHYCSPDAAVGDARDEAAEMPHAESSTKEITRNGEPEDPDAMRSLVGTLRQQIHDSDGQTASLNAKLVASFSRIGDLEDALERQQEENVANSRRMRQLEAEKAAWESRVEGGLLVEKAHVQTELTRMMDRVIEETAQRGKAETDKATMESELEALTANLFDEANKMVATERVARAGAVAKAGNLEERLKDNELLMSQTELLMRQQATQMRTLGARVEELEREKATWQTRSLAPAVTSIDVGLAKSPLDEHAPISPTHANFSTAELASRLLVEHLPRYELQNFVKHLLKLRASTLSKPADAPASGANAAGLRAGLLAPTASPSTSGSIGPDHQAALTAQLPLSTHNSQAFVKRLVEEDSDPALRLDNAPGLSWLNRRGIASAVLDGSLVIEPAFGGVPTDRCTLCGGPLDTNNRSSALNNVSSGQAAMRKLMGLGSSPGWTKWSRQSAGSANGTATPPFQVHVFRTSSTSESSSAYPVCSSYCLPRLRGACELWTYVRNIVRAVLVENSVPQPTASGRYPRRNTSGLGLGTFLRRTTSSGAIGDASESPLPSPVTAAPAASTDSVEATTDEPESKGEPTESQDEPTESQDEAVAPEATAADDIAAVEPDPAAASVEAEASVESVASSSTSAPVRPPLPARSSARAVPATPAPPVATSPSPSPQLPPRPNVTSPGKTAPEDGPLDAWGLWEQRTWTELVRLREDLFWARIGVHS